MNNTLGIIFGIITLYFLASAVVTRKADEEAANEVHTALDNFGKEYKTAGPWQRAGNYFPRLRMFG